MFQHDLVDRELALIFLTSARCGCFRQAARILNKHIVPMRKKLKKLETVLGDRLFVFEDRSLRLTAAGQALQAKLTLIFGDVM